MAGLLLVEVAHSRFSSAAQCRHQLYRRPAQENQQMIHSNTSRRSFLTSTLLGGVGFMFGTEGAPGAPSPESGGYWPHGARLAVSLSLMFEGGGQPISGAGGVIPDPIEKGLPD